RRLHLSRKIPRSVQRAICPTSLESPRKCRRARRAIDPDQVRNIQGSGAATERFWPGAGPAGEGGPSRLPARTLFGWGLLLHLDPCRHHETGNHVVAGDGPDELHHLRIRQERAHVLHRGGRDLDLAGHLASQLERRALGFVEQLRVSALLGGAGAERVELLPGPARLEELSLVLAPLVFGLVEDADL